MNYCLIRAAVCGALIGTLSACGGGGGDGSSSSGSFSSSQQTGSVPLLVSDASSDDWATIGVKVLSVALIPQGGGGNVTIYSAPSSAPYVNLEQLDQLGEILGNVAVPVGTYTGAVVTLAGNPGDVLLTAAANPEAGFSLPGGTQVAAGDIHIQNTQGSAPNLTVPITVDFASPLTVSSSQNNALDLEFDLANPAFIVGHLPPGAGSTQWAVNFRGPLRHHLVADLPGLVLRHLYGTVTAIASDNSSITVTRDFPALPVRTPETAVAGSQSLTILADATNGTLFYDLDAHSVTTIRNFGGESDLDSKFVRVAARYQQDGSLVATRIWASSSFQNVWVSPEGHVLHVDTGNDIVTIANDSGGAVPVLVDASTQFYYRQPSNPAADAAPIGTGPAFLTDQNLVRGFKVHASVDPTTTPMLAQSIEIETAAYSGAISQPTTSSFTYTHDYLRASDDYSVTLDYIGADVANAAFLTGSAVNGYEWWNFAYPTLADSGSSAITDFVAATGGTVSFGGTAGMIPTWGVTYAQWGGGGGAPGWNAAATVLLPAPIPFATVSTALSGASGAYTFAVTASGGTQPVTVDVDANSGEATLAYQVDYSGGIVSISPVDITSAGGLMTLTNGLAAGTKVEIAGIPQSDGTLKSYVIVYFTNTTPAS